MNRYLRPLAAFSERLSPNSRGMVWMILSGLAFTIHLGLVKYLGGEFGSGLLAFFRATAGMLVILPVLLRTKASSLKVHQPGLMLLRGGLASAGFLLSFAAIAIMPMSQFNAISFSRPLFVIVLAAIFLHEKVGAQRWMATGIGCVGVVIIVQPSMQMEASSLLALGAALAFAASIVMVKELSRLHSTITLIVATNLLSGLFTLPFAINEWQTPQGEQWLVIAAMAISATATQACYIKGMAVGEASYVTAMDFLRLPMAVAADWLVFKTLPGFWVWPGTALIIAATAYISIREARARERARVEAAMPVPPDPHL